MTEWRAIPGYEGRYEVSDEGQVRSLSHTTPHIWRGRSVARPHRGRMLALVLDSYGYPVVNLRPRVRVHRLVLMAFVGMPTAGQVGRHLDDNRQNNAVSNLAWGTQADNHADAIRNYGHFNRGSNSKSAKLTEDDVRWVRRNASRLAGKAMARQLNVTPTTIRGIIRGRIWSHLPDVG
jgi:hypothetical protein